MKKTAALLALLLLLAAASANAAPEYISAKSAILADKTSGRVLYEKNGFEKLPMASTTKIMTALLVLENCSPGSVVTVSANASGVEGSSLWLEVGERLTVRQLLLGLMLKSGNDAAVALAEHTAGSVEAFVLMMNERAREIGMFNTSFETPNGLDSENHYTTAYDMALLARTAMSNPDFVKIASTKEAQLPWANREWNRSLKNHNKLLWQYEGCTGIKTGFTKKSGRCLVSSAVRDGRELICVTLNAPDDWSDHKKLLDYGFEEFNTAVLLKKGTTVEKISVGEEELGLVAAEDFVTSMRPNERAEYRTEISPVSLPVQKGEKSGSVYMFAEGEFLGSADLLAAESIAAPMKFNDYLMKILEGFI